MNYNSINMRIPNGSRSVDIFSKDSAVPSLQTYQFIADGAGRTFTVDLFDYAGNLIAQQTGTIGASATLFEAISGITLDSACGAIVTAITGGNVYYLEGNAVVVVTAGNGIKLEVGSILGAVDDRLLIARKLKGGASNGNSNVGVGGEYKTLPYHLVCGNSENAVLVSNLAKGFHGFDAEHINNLPVYLKIYDLNRVPSAADTPVQAYMIPANATPTNGDGIVNNFGKPIVLNSGLGIRVVKDMAVNGTGAVDANEVMINLRWSTNA